MQSGQNQQSVPASRVAFMSRHEFPEHFVFGASASAFQYEGAHDRDGKGESIWDTFLKENYPDLVEKEKALDAIHFYDRYKDDVKIMKGMGIDAYRFSISWPRVLPNGRRTKGPNGEEQGVNKLGIDFYNKFINELINNQIEPVVTLFHWDLPQALEDEYLGFLSSKVVDDFRDFADLCFREFGDRVKRWITFNETWTYSFGGYFMGTTAPGRGINFQPLLKFFEDVLPSSRATSRRNCLKIPTIGNPFTEIYIVTHNQLLAHATAVKLYREKYKKCQNGQIGNALVSLWALPYTDEKEDKDAAIRAVKFMLGWLLNPLIKGKYPKCMRTLVGRRLPEFSPEEANDVKGSFDFIALQYYTSNYAANFPRSFDWPIIYNLDSRVLCYKEKDGIPIGEKGGSDWLYSYPEGIKELLLYIAKKYNNPPIYITENGIDEVNDPKLSLIEAFYDYPRISYHYKHLSAVKEAIDQGANVKGYFAWSLLDNLEGAQGFETRFGINFVHFAANYERFPKLSSAWFKFLLEKEPQK